MKLSDPEKPVAGVYVNEPSGLSLTPPWLACETRTAESVWPASGSVSLASTPGAATVVGVTAVAVYALFVATGGRSFVVTGAVMNPRSSNQSRVSGVPVTGPS